MSLVLLIDSTFKICACFISAIIHETGHLIAMACFGIKPKSITLHAFDISIDADAPKSEFQDMIITLSGPLINFVFSIIFIGFSMTMCVSNLVIGIFNLLPIDTFDGGHALTLLLNRRLSLYATNLIIKALTFIFLIPFLFFGVMMLFYSKYNYSLLLISLYLLAILFTK